MWMRDGRRRFARGGRRARLTHRIHSTMKETGCGKIFLRKGVAAILFVVIAAGCALATGCSRAPTPSAAQPSEKPTPVVLRSSPAPDTSLQSLFSHIWRVTKTPSRPPSGSIYIFLPNGTLLETSCVETYRVATWTVDKAAPRELRVVEDHQLAFTANIAELTDSTLRLQKQLVRSKEIQDVTYSAIEGEFVCPDMPK
jgi:hypothetical protein